MTGSRTSGRALACAVCAIWAACLADAACGGAQRKTDADPVPAPPAASANGGPARTPSTPIDQRRDAACEQLGPKLTACAVEDARADLAAGKITKAQLDRDIAPEVQRKNTEKFLEACKGASYSSRQVRVLEVCPKEESECGPMLSCLDNLNKK